VVVANLSAPLLRAHAAPIAGLRNAEGALVLAGLLDADLPDVQAAYATSGEPEARLDGEWAALVYRGAS
jgi:ribosomal protein L11 methylase PrmA